MSDIRVYAFSDEASADIDGQINALIRNRLQGMEIRNVDGTNVSDITAQKAKEVKNKLDAHGLCVWSVGSPIGKINITDDFGKHLDKFKHTLEIAKILDSRNIRLFSFYAPKRKNPDNYKNDVIDRLGQFCEEAKKYNIVLCHENEKGIFGDTAERCLEIHKALPDIKGVFDPANFVQCGVNTLNAWEMLKDYVYYMHIKDALPSGFVVPAGKGAGNVQKIAEEYISHGGTDFTIEPHLIAFKGLKFLERIGEKRQLNYKYSDSDTAFDVACNSFRELI